MSKTVSKRALQALVKFAEDNYCDHRRGDHEPGHCDYLLITPEEITQILEGTA